MAAAIIGSLTGLIGLAVFFLSLTYLGTVLAAIRLISRAPERRLRYAGSRVVLLLALLSNIYLMTQTEKWILVIGMTLLAVGVLVYVFFAP